MLTEVLPITPLFAYYLSRATCRARRTADRQTRQAASLRKLPALKTILIDDHADSAAAAIFKTADYSPAAIHLHIGFRADDIGGGGKRKNDSRTHPHHPTPPA